jgi:hypothetical protein
MQSRQICSPRYESWGLTRRLEWLLLTIWPHFSQALFWIWLQSLQMGFSVTDYGRANGLLQICEVFVVDTESDKRFGYRCIVYPALLGVVGYWYVQAHDNDDLVLASMCCSNVFYTHCHWLFALQYALSFCAAIWTVMGWFRVDSCWSRLHQFGKILCPTRHI